MNFKKYIILALTCLSSAFSTETYNVTQSQVGVWLSGAAYCDKDVYPTMKLSGPAQGFVMTDVLYDKKTDLQGFVGLLPSTSSIYVVFRGSSSILNWLDDAEALKMYYDTFPECDCKVHTGFYTATLALKSQTIDALHKLKTMYPTYKIVTSGHSLGAAISQLISMELAAINIRSTVYNYGQPRIGDKKYAAFVNTKLMEMWRFTHNRDIVPHIPPIKEMYYYHSCREVFQDEHDVVKTCSNTNCEDPSCTDQYSLHQTSGKDHETYLNHDLSCEASTGY